MRLARRDLALLAAITAGAAALRFATLGLQSYWYDESVTVDLVRRSFVGMLRAIPGSESTPPLYYAVAWVWSQAFGSGTVGLRSLSALVGTAAVPAAYAATRALASRGAALVAATFVAVSPILVWYSQEARAYALLVLLTTLALLFFARALRREGRRDLLWWSVTASLALTTHYFAVFVVAPQAVWLVARLRARRREAVAAVGGVTAVALALLPLAVHQERAGRTSWIHAAPLRTRVKDTAHLFLSGFYPLTHAGLLAVAVGVCTAIALLVRVRGSDRWGGLVALSVGVAGLALPLLLALASDGFDGRGDYFFFRNLLAAWVPLAIAVAVVVVAIRPPVAVAAVVALAAALLVLATVRIDSRAELQRDDWRAVDRALGPRQPGRAIVISPDWQVSALELYRPALDELSASGAPLDEIVVVTPEFGNYPSGFEYPGGFKDDSRRVVQHFALIKLRAPKLRRLTARDLFPSNSDTTDAAILLDRLQR